jgi:hypothetical protein
MRMTDYTTTVVLTAPTSGVLGKYSQLQALANSRRSGQAGTEKKEGLLNGTAPHAQALS